MKHDPGLEKGTWLFGWLAHAVFLNLNSQLNEKPLVNGLTMFKGQNLLFLDQGNLNLWIQEMFNLFTQMIMILRNVSPSVGFYEKLDLL